MKEELNKWQIYNDYPTDYDGLIKLAYHFAKWQKKQLMKDVIIGIARPADSELWCNLDSFNLKDGEQCKLIIIKN